MFELKITNITNFYSMSDQVPIDMPLLRTKILHGLTLIQKGVHEQEAVLFIGDTGVGKSTLLAYLTGHHLQVQQIGLKPCLATCTQGLNEIKIGHQKYSETSVPVKVECGELTIYDCPGFNDNKSREDEIANSFYYQRLVSLYPRTKLVIVVEESYLTECRAHRLPSLAKKLSQAFGDLGLIRASTLLIVNKCDPDSELQDVERQLRKVISTKGMFSQEQVQFFESLMRNGQLHWFRQPRRSQLGKQVGEEERAVLAGKVRGLEFMGKVDISNIISDVAKLAIRDYLDVLTLQSTKTVGQVLDGVKGAVGAAKTGLYLMKQQIMKVFDCKEQMKTSNDFTPFFQFCRHRQVKAEELQQLKQELEVVEFLSQVYSREKTRSYYLNTLSLILTGLSIILHTIDTMIEDEKLEAQRKKRKEQMKREEEELKALENRNKENQPPVARKPEHKTVTPSRPTKSGLGEKEQVKREGESPVIAFQRKLMNAQLKIKQISYQICEFHNKASYVSSTLGNR